MLGRGVSRSVYRVGPWAVKVPGGLGGYRPTAVVRGWLANRSEWQQRWRATVNRPRWTVGCVVQGYPLAEVVTPAELEWWENVQAPRLELLGFSSEEAKASSWGRVDGHWVLLDFDRCWESPRGWVGGLYWWNQERLGRKWAKLAPPNP